MKFDNSKILLGILICLIFIVLKPAPEYPTYHQPNFPSSLEGGETVVPLGENRIAIVDTDNSSGYHGEIMIMEYNDSSSQFELIGKHNYIEDFFE
ncbi:hypothetical protein [Paucisalibacillus globulus]|uniref:hypothetical protein n=1 Tax=Paucisalibacillus globulus TaxID=351095 RepID=UPI00040B82C8|nr:hypothetical protein [Paucisalibacillus globulus]